MSFVTNTETVISGWLEKRGPLVDWNWLRRWCVLATEKKWLGQRCTSLSTKLTWFADTACTDRRGYVELDSDSLIKVYIDVAALSDHAGTFVEKRPHSFTLDMYPSNGTLQRLFHFDACSQDALEAWTSSIRDAVKQLSTFAARRYSANLLSRASDGSYEKQTRRLGDLERAASSGFRRMSARRSTCLSLKKVSPEKLKLLAAETRQFEAIGDEGKTNSVLFKLQDRLRCVVFFPGDISDFRQNMAVMKEYSLEELHEVIASRFPSQSILTIRASCLDPGPSGFPLACYNNFLSKAPPMAPLGAAKHLKRLLADVGEKSGSEISSAQLTLVGFSRGGLPLTAVLHDDLDDQEGLKQRISAIHYLDVGLLTPGPAYASKDAVERLPEAASLYVHLTDYIAKPGNGYWRSIGQSMVDNASRLSNAKLTLHSCGDTLESHFDLLNEFVP
eukprot:TRINITY_DN34423_c0_g1_i1.p1 TRINITY_DN34423_c0_g1~~TRINITY_DN34423_c0_g1_i1.p1  ORF type:complete len:446 (+),score=47.73 TRINITY_DN34423_c0_g1_i1:220-1557(+)